MPLHADALRACGQRTIDWAAGLLGPAGFTAAADDIQAHYKAPCAFVLAGRPNAAMRVGQHLADRFHADGDFHANPRDAGARMGGANYRNAWIVRGLHLLGRYDLSEPGLAHLERQLDPRTGGCRLVPADWGIGDDLDFGTTCSAAIAFLAAGRVASARRCGAFLADVVTRQLPGSARLALRTTASGTAVMPEAEGLAPYVINAEGPSRAQLYWPLGMALVAFARLSRATGEAHWQRPANLLLDFILRCGPDVATHITNGKIAWGLGEMSLVSSNPVYRSFGEDVLRNIIAAQEPSGIWVRRPQYATEADQPVATSLDTSLERAAYMFDLAKVYAG
jgi:hypothetical protein